MRTRMGTNGVSVHFLKTIVRLRHVSYCQSFAVAHVDLLDAEDWTVTSTRHPSLPCCDSSASGALLHDGCSLAKGHQTPSLNLWPWDRHIPRGSQVTHENMCAYSRIDSL